MTNSPPSTTCDHPTRRLLPWLINGQISAEEAAAVDAHLRTCASCRAERSWDQSLAAALAHSERVEYAPNAALQQFMSQLSDEDATDAELASVEAPSRTRRRRRPLHIAAVAAASGLAIVLTGWLFASRLAAPPVTYTTLTAPESSPGAASLRLVVDPAISLAEFAALLHAVHGQLVAGPSPAGVYTVALSDANGDSVSHALARLRADPRVQFAEPVAAAPAPRTP